MSSPVDSDGSRKSNLDSPSGGDSMPNRPGGWLWAFIFTVFALSIFYQLRNVPSWIIVQRHLAAADDAVAAHDWAKAVAEMDKAIARDPSASVYARRALLRTQKSQLERSSGLFEDSRLTADSALADINRSIELDAQFQYYHQRATIHELLDQFREAVVDWTLFLQTCDAPRSSHDVDTLLAIGLNSRAYMRALGEFEISEAIADIEKALKILPQNELRRFQYEDTKAYLLYLNGQAEDALPILEDCLSTAEQRRGESPQLASKDDLAVIRHHRGLVYKAMGKHSAAEVDFRKALELGFDPQRGIR